MPDKKEILVLGAGVSGLSSAILLLEKGYKVRIRAKELPPNTTSDVAAAVWYPYLCKPPHKAAKWSGFTLRYLKEKVMADPASGCIQRTITEIFDRKVEEPWWKEAVETYRRPAPDELPDGYVDAYQTEAIVTDSTKYMDWLLARFQALGGTIERIEVDNIEQAFGDYDIVVNCTGLGARSLFNDQSVYPVRGQVVCVKPNGFEQVVADDDGPNNLLVIIPRLNDIVIGGTIQANNWSLKVDPKDTTEILRKARSLYPVFKNVEIIQEKVGLRPVRDEVRLEVEVFGDKYVVHNYGHGGAGYTLSWGCANDVVNLIEEL